MKPNPPGKYLSLNVKNHVGWLEFNRPKVNTFHPEMVQEVIETLRYFEADASVRVIVLASALHQHFSAGAELSTLIDISEDGMAGLCDMLHDVVYCLRKSKRPMLAAIHGIAVGAGLEMTLHCDVRFAAQDARLGQPEVFINFIPPVGATQALVRLIGRPRAVRYLYDGKLLSAEEAFALGLVDELVPEEELRKRVQCYAESLCEKPPEALASIRRSIIEGGGLCFDDGLQLEREEAIKLSGTENFAEGVRAFLEKRDPAWRR